MLVVLDGLDATGKATQARSLAATLVQKGTKATVVTFPRYTETMTGSMAQSWLRGDYGAVGPELAALVFAADRVESKALLHQYSRENEVLIADRWVSSNQAYQGARVPASARQRFVEWVAELEYDAFGATVPDLTFYLRGDPEFAWQQARARADTSGVDTDLYEADRGFLKAVAETYESLAVTFGWTVVEVLDSSRNMFRPAHEITEELLTFLPDTLTAVR